MKGILTVIGIIVLLFALGFYNQNQSGDLFWVFVACLLLLPGFLAVCFAISKNTSPPNYR